MNDSLTPVAFSQTLKMAVSVLVAKRTGLKKIASDINTIAIGSSHGDFGFNPEFCLGSFNLCSRSQDLKHSGHLYKKALESCKNIKNLVIFYSVFSPGFELEKIRGENEICLALNEVFKLGFTYNDPLLHRLAKAIANGLEELNIEAGINGFMPDIGKGFFPETYGAENRANDHLKLNASTSENSYLTKLLRLADNSGHRVIIVIPPVRCDYRKAIIDASPDPFLSLFHTLDESSTIKMPVVLNFFEDCTFLDQYFGDFDHLLPKGEGTKILSSQVFETILQLD